MFARDQWGDHADGIHSVRHHIHLDRVIDGGTIKLVIATDFTGFSTSLENGVGRNSTPLPTSKTTRGSGGMADTIVLGTIAARREGSSPFSPTKHKNTGRHS